MMMATEPATPKAITAARFTMLPERPWAARMGWEPSIWPIMVG
jgi:hypothetical protein